MIKLTSKNTIIVLSCIAVVLLGLMAYILSRDRKTSNAPSQTPNIEAQSSSTKVEDIEADITSTELSNLDAEISEIEQELGR